MTVPVPELAAGAGELFSPLPVLELPVLELPVLELPVLELPVADPWVWLADCCVEAA